MRIERLGVREKAHNAIFDEDAVAAQQLSRNNLAIIGATFVSMNARVFLRIANSSALRVCANR
jgi:hypothetical protein